MKEMVLATLEWVFGEFNGLIYALIAFVVIDYITGVLCAITERKLSSDVGFRGISKKIMIFAMVAVGNVLDVVFAGVEADFSAIRAIIIIFYFINEGLSILENATRLGLPVPQKLKDTLAKLHKKEIQNEAA